MGEDDEFEDLTEDAKRLQEQELNKVREMRRAALCRAGLWNTVYPVNHRAVCNV